MFKVERISTNRLDIQINGRIDAEQMKTALDELISKSATIDNGVMLYDIIDVHLPSFGAIAIEFSRLPSMLKVIAKFSRVAVLTDTHWLKKASEFEGALFPNMEIKAFDRDQREAAETWLLH